MTTTAIRTAQEQMHRLATKALAVSNDNTRTIADRKAELDRIEADIKKYSDEIGVHQRASQLAVGASSAGSNPFGGVHRPAAGVGGASYAGAGPVLPRVEGATPLAGPPRLDFTPDVLKGIHFACKTKAPFKADLTTKDFRDAVQTKESPMSVSPMIPPTLLPGVVEQFRYEPTRLANYIPTSSIGTPSIEWLQHTGTTGAFGTVSPGGTKPEVEPQWNSQTLTVQKIAGWASVFDETLEDFEQFSNIVTGELMKAMYDCENQQILSGNGTAPNLLGILNTTGISNASLAGTGTGAQIDALELAIANLRSSTPFLKPDLIVLHPQDWSTIRRSKDNYGRYLLSADPTQGEADTAWGIRVVVTTTLPQGTGLMGNFEYGAALFYRRGPELMTSNSDSTDFVQNITKFRLEERLTLGVFLPAAFTKLTNIP